MFSSPFTHAPQYLQDLNTPPQSTPIYPYSHITTRECDISHIAPTTPAGYQHLSTKLTGTAKPQITQAGHQHLSTKLTGTVKPQPKAEVIEPHIKWLVTSQLGFAVGQILTNRILQKELQYIATKALPIIEDSNALVQLINDPIIDGLLYFTGAVAMYAFANPAVSPQLKIAGTAYNILSFATQKIGSAYYNDDNKVAAAVLFVTSAILGIGAVVLLSAQTIPIAAYALAIGGTALLDYLYGSSPENPDSNWQANLVAIPAAVASMALGGGLITAINIMYTSHLIASNIIGHYHSSDSESSDIISDIDQVITALEVM